MSSKSLLREKTQRRFEFSFRVLRYKEDGVFVAHALEADIVGCGDSPEEAFEQLQEALEAQISFAIQQKDPSLIEGKAPEELERKWQEIHRKSLLERPHEDRSASSPEWDAEYLVFSSREISELRESPLKPAFA